MGLDAYVRCRCFEEGKLKPGLMPAEDLYIDEDGNLSSRKLDKEYERLGYERFYEIYGELVRAFLDWCDTCCEHESGEYCSERVSNIAGCAEFQELVEEVGGEERFPLLSHLLPDGNGGMYPASKAQATLEELDRFIAAVSNVDQWVLCDEETGEEVWTSTKGGCFTWMLGPYDKVGMDGGKVFFEHAGRPRVETAHFRQRPFGRPGINGDQHMTITCLDTGAETMAFDSLGPEGSPKVERTFCVTSKKAPFLYEGKYWTAERLRNLLVASIETGNPIQWC